MTRRRAVSLAFSAVFAVLMLPALCRAQDREPALSDAEVEKLRDTAPVAHDRILVFIGFLDQRCARIDKLTTGKRQPGREEDIHEMMQQITSVLDDLEDNLDEYARRHADMRKVLPKLISATERWGTALKTPPEDQTYSVSRKLALESLNDVHESALKLIDEQKTWFAAHPPGKEGIRSDSR